MRKYSIILVTMAVLSACSGGKVKLSGRFAGSDKQTLYLEQVSAGRQSVVDSVKTDEKGNFAFRIKLPDNQPTIYNLRYNGELIPLLLSPGESVKLSSAGNIVQNYTVSGSEGSEEMRQLKMILSEGATRLDSIMTAYAKASEAERPALAKMYADAYYKAKREHIEFIVSNPGSLAALYGLYQRFPNDNTLFNGESDLVYYKLVADSVEANYPDSPYLKALQQQISAAEQGNSVIQMINDKIAATTVRYPDVELPDMYGKKHRLSALDGKVILLDFWSAASSDSKLNNAELKKWYAEAAERGFEVYQVSVDDSKALWVTTVQNQKLPWITVCDFKGGSGIAVMAYNVQSVPTNFLIDRQGNIAGKDLYGAALRDKVFQLLN